MLIYTPIFQITIESISKKCRLLQANCRRKSLPTAIICTNKFLKFKRVPMSRNREKFPSYGIEVSSERIPLLGGRFF